MAQAGKDEQVASAMAAGDAFMFEAWDGPPVPVLFTASPGSTTAVRLSLLSRLCLG